MGNTVDKGIGVYFGGAAQARAPPIIEKRPCISHFLPPFPPTFWFAHPIFLTILCRWIREGNVKCGRIREGDVKYGW